MGSFMSLCKANEMDVIVGFLHWPMQSLFVQGRIPASAKHRKEGGWYLALDVGNGTTKNAYPNQNKFGEKTQNMSGIVTTAEYNKYCVQLLLNT